MKTHWRLSHESAGVMEVVARQRTYRIKAPVAKQVIPMTLAIQGMSDLLVQAKMKRPTGSRMTAPRAGTRRCS